MSPAPSPPVRQLLGARSTLSSGSPPQNQALGAQWRHFNDIDCLPQPLSQPPLPSWCLLGSPKSMTCPQILVSGSVSGEPKPRMFLTPPQLLSEQETGELVRDQQLFRDQVLHSSPCMWGV